MSENLSYTEISARLHYSEKHIEYLSTELMNAAAEINELKNELNRVNEPLRLAVKKTYAPSSEESRTAGSLRYLKKRKRSRLP